MACGHPGQRCPALAGEPCPLAEGADAIVMAFPSGDPRGEALLHAHEQLHGGVPVVVELPTQDADGTAACRLATGTLSPELQDRLEQVLELD
jgi:hypothetical protein